MYNKTVMVGKVASQVYTKTLDSGKVVSNFRVETNDYNKQYHTINCYEKTAELAKDLKEGDVVFLEGRVSTRSYNDKNGDKKYVTTINCARVALIEGERRHEETVSESAWGSTPSASADTVATIDDLGF